ncbi:MAG: noncanonical pyrimidine nucleotidase, YjjG family [Fimbriimonadaceae bacterium]|nr:noncanonical pyrimidine nucleotidase, YjjG family [Chitinophagales bacterium]
MQLFKNIKHIFFDLDNTLWDFSGNSKRIVYEMYHQFNLAEKGIKDFEIFHAQYKFRNENLWHAYSFGNATREEVRLHRFLYTLDDFGVTDYAIAMQMADHYVHHTKNQTDLLPYTVEILDHLQNAYQLHIITNGFNEVQYFKLKNCSIDRYFKTVTTAEEAKCLKPDKRIFEIALQKAYALAAESLYIGDTPTVDGAGSINAGMQFIFFNPDKKENSKGYFQIHSLEELKI